jgi:RNA polymerase subunit RPABC4/transcription elongation factor Spt4
VSRQKQDMKKGMNTPAAVCKKATASEELEKVRKEIAVVKSDNIKLSTLVTVAKEIIADLLGDCPYCSQKMLALDWNGKVFILTCHNGACPKYHTPLKHLRKEGLRLLGVEEESK